ncbi:voltage-dependent T-type calcium channel subunit alpha-1I isoform X2 [Scyliorhinus canicula]|uniref:voltage-dependent T-type calcium channel subunit alpha-1I isoform X2 n=1 Tax=Scyliorhinus canicula TaxID=7830 RepID=UPI0018F7552D|nr:voltage-dependent T-type calcium channel subunit alpha-1I isoform X2 [Scyliorhinus canicula]
MPNFKASQLFIPQVKRALIGWKVDSDLKVPGSTPEFGIQNIQRQGPSVDSAHEARPVDFFSLTPFLTWFEHVSMLVIILNCVTLGMYQPCEDVDCASDRCRILQAFDDFIFVFFAMEMVVKMVALGIVGKKCYLGDTWNRLDFFIVMSGMVEYSLDLQNVSLSAIRTVRVLRPLKAINRVPSMRILVNLLLDTLPMLGNVLLLCFFVFFIFGIIGVQLWAGLLRNRCFLEHNLTLYNGLSLPQYYHPEKDDETPFICSLSGDNGIMGCHEIPALRDNGHECCLDKDDYYYYAALGQELNVTGGCVNWNRYYTVCQTGDRNPHKGAINFDNIVYAWIVIFQVITLEGWVEIMYYVMDAHSFYNFIYFILLIIVGSFFMINLCLVVIATQFSETKQREHQLMQEQRALYLSSSTVASFAEPGDCYEEIFQYVCHILRKAKRRTVGLFASLQTRFHSYRGTADFSICQECGHYHAAESLQHTPHAIVQPIALTLTSDPSHCSQCNSVELAPGAKAEELADAEAGEAREAELYKEAESEAQGRERPEDQTRCYAGLWADMRRKLMSIVESKYFNRGIMMAILINTISMGIEHHEQPEELTNVLEISNIVFTSMFALEMILKLSAFGFFSYLRNPYNIFDGIIVIISVCEIVGQSDGGLSVLRTFRLLRVLKLVRFMPALRRQLVVLMKTMDNVATFCMLLMLFIFIFSILGMHIFGCKFSLKTDGGDTVPDRKNFDSLLWAIVTVFQILTQEDWNVVLYNGMASTSPCAALYFVALMTFGNYVLFNLLVAILVEGFQAEGDANKSDSEEERTSTNFEDCEKIKEMHYLSEKAVSIVMTPNGHLDMSPQNQHRGSRGSFQPENLYNSAESRKSSVTSLTRLNFDQKSLSSRRSSHYIPWGAGGSWGSRRASWNSMGRASSLKRRPHSGGEHESLLSGSRRKVSSSDNDPEDIRSEAVSSSGLLHRRALSLDTKGSGDLPELLQVPAIQPPGRKNSLATVTMDHRDCNGKGPHIVKEIFPKMNNRKEKSGYDEELDYSLCFRIQKMVEIYKPDWCDTRADWSVYLFSPQNRFRLMCQMIIAHKLFDYIVLAFIFLNCITVALERPDIGQGSTERIFLSVSNYFFTAIFVAEMTLKVVSLGFYIGDQAYLRSSWNILDGFLVFVSLIDIVVSVASAGGAKILGVLRVLRLLRTLRPLRVISRAPGLKLVVETLISSLKPIGNIVLICCAFFIIFGILGVQLFKGKFYYCQGQDTRNVTNRSDCLLANYRWIHHKYNFDNLGQALMSLFVLASKDGWVNIMYHGLDAVSIDQQPIINHNPWMLLYFISFLLIVSFFVLNMFVGVVVENFHKCRQHQEAEEARRREEKRLKRLEKKRRKAQRLPYYAAYSPIRLFIHTICTSHYLDLFITFTICINVVTMSLEHYNQPKSLEVSLKYCNYMFTAVFVLEAILKLVSFGLRRFFKERWNQLDLAIVLLSVMGITLEEIEISAALPINPTIIRIMRVLRITRVLKLLKMATGMRALLDTVVQALPQVGNLGLLFMLLFFIYAALGVELFGRLICDVDHPCEGMSRHATFENFGMAFLTLFQVSTGDNWNGIMKDTLRDCSNDDRGCFSNLQLISPLYFVSFVLTAQFVLINVVVAVLMKHLDDSNKEAQEDAELDAEIEMELAQGLCSQPSSAPGPGIGSGVDSGHKGNKKKGERPDPGKHISPAQESLWLDSVSLIIRDTFENELLMIDNLSGSIFHHYTSSPNCRNCQHDKQEVHLAETEAFSLTSDFLSDKSSSVVLADDLSSDDSAPQLTARESDEKEGTDSPGVPENVGVGMLTAKETVICRTNSLPNNSYISQIENPDSGQTVTETQPVPAEQIAVTPLQTPSPAACLQFETELFHPVTLPSAEQKHSSQLPKMPSSGSWTLLQSPGMAWSLQRQVAISDTSLSDGSVDSLQTTLEDRLRLAVSPQCTLALPMVCTDLSAQRTASSFTPPLRKKNLQRRRGLGLQMMRGRQRSQSSGGSTSPGCTYQDSMDPSDEEGIAHSLRANSEQSETLSSLSLTSLFSPSRSPPSPIKKCNSTGTLDAASRGKGGKQFYTVDQQGFLTAPSWVADFCRNNHPASGLEGQGTDPGSQTEDVKIAQGRPSSQVQSGSGYNATMQKKKR